MAEGPGEEVYRSVRPDGVYREFKRGRMNGDKVKVVARVRPFTENEKVCPLKQVLCYGDKIRVKEHDHQPSKYSGRSTDGLEFNFDYVQDDSYVPVHDRDRKEESQKRMYQALGAPCVEFALKDTGLRPNRIRKDLHYGRGRDVSRERAHANVNL